MVSSKIEAVNFDDVVKKDKIDHLTKKIMIIICGYATVLLFAIFKYATIPYGHDHEVVNITRWMRQKHGMREWQRLMLWITITCTESVVSFKFVVLDISIRFSFSCRKNFQHMAIWFRVSYTKEHFSLFYYTIRHILLGAHDEIEVFF